MKATSETSAPAGNLTLQNFFVNVLEAATEIERRRAARLQKKGGKEKGAEDAPLETIASSQPA